MLLMMLVGALLEHKVVEGDEVEHTLLKVDHQQVVVVGFALVLVLVVEVQVNKYIVHGTRHHYYEHKDEKKVHLKLIMKGLFCYLGGDHAAYFSGHKIDFVAEHQIQDRPKHRQEYTEESKKVGYTQEGVLEVNFLPVELVD